jgi:hypothetical protein
MYQVQKRCQSAAVFGRPHRSEAPFPNTRRFVRIGYQHHLCRVHLCGPLFHVWIFHRLAEPSVTCLLWRRKFERLPHAIDRNVASYSMAFSIPVSQGLALDSSSAPNHSNASRTTPREGNCCWFAIRRSNFATVTSEPTHAL